MINRKTKNKTSLFGRFLHHLEKSICNNLNKFIGRHEKVIEVFFLMLFILLQIGLAIHSKSRIVTCIIIIFLFLLALERISVHVWLDYERKGLAKREEKIKNKAKSLRLFHIHERSKLIDEINKLKLKAKR